MSYLLLAYLLVARFHTSYGWFGIWDWIHNTDEKFDKSTVHK